MDIPGEWPRATDYFVATTDDDGVCLRCPAPKCPWLLPLRGATRLATALQNALEHRWEAHGASVDGEALRPWLQLCASCDAGLPATCTCPAGDPRAVIFALVRQIEQLTIGNRSEYGAHYGNRISALAHNHERLDLWMEEHGIGHGAGISAVLFAVAHDMREGRFLLEADR